MFQRGLQPPYAIILMNFGKRLCGQCTIPHELMLLLFLEEKYPSRMRRIHTKAPGVTCSQIEMVASIYHSEEYHSKINSMSSDCLQNATSFQPDQA